MAPDPESLSELRERLRQTQEAAEKLAGGIPAQGWASAGDREAAASEVQALVSVLGVLRDVVPEDLWEQVREVVRRLLLLLRAILDLVVERLAADRPAGAPRPAGPDLQDIPIA